MMIDSNTPLIDRIRVAFANLPRPSADALVVATSDDEGAASCFSGKDVGSIPLEGFVSHCTAPWFFVDEALLYYLPGFMNAVLNGADGGGVIWGHLYAQFVPERRPGLVAKMTNEQRRCIVEFCRSCGAEEEDIAPLLVALKLDSSS